MAIALVATACQIPGEEQSTPNSPAAAGAENDGAIEAGGEGVETQVAGTEDATVEVAARRTARNDMLTVLDEGPNRRWQDWSWGQRNLSDASDAASGATSAMFDFGPWDGLYLHHGKGVDISGYSTLSFMVKGGSESNPRILTQLIAPGDNWLAGAEIAAFCDGGIQPGVWTTCNVPLETLAGDNSTIDGIAFQEWAGSDLAPMWFDQIVLRTDAATPTATPAVDPKPEPKPADTPVLPDPVGETPPTAPPTDTPAAPNPASTPNTTVTAPAPKAPSKPAPTGDLSALKVKGRDLVNANGQAVMLRGADLLRSEWDLNMNFERRAFPELKNWGSNVVKRGFASDPVIDPGFATSIYGNTMTHADYMGFLDEYVELGSANGSYVVLSWRSNEINGDQPTMPNQNALRAMAILAERYKDQSHVILSLQEEPHDVSWNQVQPMFQQMTDAIYAAAAPAEPLVIVPGTNWSRDLASAVTNPVNGANVIYKTHPHNDKSLFAEQFMNPYEAGLPVLIGNFGPVEFGGVYDSDMDDVAVILDWAEARNVGWIGWMFDQGGNPGMITDNGSMTPTEFGAMTRKFMGG